MKLTDKKTGIKAIERLLGEKAVYSGPPKFEYRFNNFLIDRDGNVSCNDPDKLLILEQNLADEGIAGEGIPHLNTTIGVNTPVAIRNLINMIHSKQYLLERALGYRAFNISNELVAALGDRDLTADIMLSRIQTFAPTGLTITDGMLTITGLPDTDTYKKLAEAMINASNLAKWVSPDETIEENEKFYMRSWLVRIGLDKADTREIRNTILKNLKGHTAFRNEDAAARWRKRH
ncbi:MAG: phage terminase small subunit P27 family [Lachnospiraceae bacterium]|nr:phage terminase small subunit P27 family [Lachnospiraceae bacterium]